MNVATPPLHIILGDKMYTCKHYHGLQRCPVFEFLEVEKML